VTSIDLTATTYLGDNTMAVLASLTDALSRHPALVRLGARVNFDAARSPTDRLAGVDEGRFDLIWVCGLYTVSRLVPAGRYRVVAVPTFAGEAGPVYRSVIVAGPDSGAASLEEAVAAGARLVANEPLSWSGYHGLIHELRRRGLPTGLVEQTSFTGTHSEAVAAVAHSAGAEPAIAAVDHTVWNHLVSSADPAAGRVVVIDRTDDWPAPPFSLRVGLEPELFDALSAALLDVTVPGLVSVTPAAAADYRLMLG
jgi:ABC-type phosphate/phosphonate transport system substrate-binding protein